MKNSLLLVFLLPQLLFAQVQVSNQQQKGVHAFTIVNDKSAASIYVDTADYKVVKHASKLLASDIERVSGKQPALLSSLTKFRGNLLIVGTLGKNKLIDALVATNKLNVEGIQNGWERFIIQTVDKPFKGVSKALVVVGSDKRGTAYGVFALSEAMGVSPWYYWADVPVKKNKNLYVKDLAYQSKAPTVKFRGIFLNDEDWGLHPWAAKNIDPTVGDIGPKTYEKVFELVLRLKGNMVAPAMHECTKAFYTVPGNMEMAEEYGIMVTTSHCEPLLYNNASEWDKKKQGEWNYATNKGEIVKALENRVKQAHQNDNIYTIALRGMHDEGMKGGPDTEKLKMLDEAIKDQRALLGKYIQKPLADIPQIFVPYKEVLGLYEKGLEVPEDISIVWPDDNYGYMKKLSNANEQKRAGGSGVYYHLSYLGWPNDYLWLNTTHPALMFAEMHKAYSLGATNYWLVNVGDIKPGEMGMQLFLDMAWDFDRFNFKTINDYQVKQLASIFGEKYESDFKYILDRYYFHGFTRKPEYMTWDWRWNSLYTLDKTIDTELSFTNYGEAESRLNDYNSISATAETILNALPEDLKPSFFQLVYYPVKGASLYNNQMLIGQKNRWYAKQGRSLTNTLADEVKLFHDSLSLITAQYNNLLDRKWKGMMTAPGFLPQPQWSPTQKIDLSQNADDAAVFVEGMVTDSIESVSLPNFYSKGNDKFFFEVYNKGVNPIKWQAYASEPWIKLDAQKGETSTQNRVHVSIDWDMVPAGIKANGRILVSYANRSKSIEVSAIRQPEGLEKMFVENNGTISIKPSAFHRKMEHGGIQFQVIDGLGYANAALQLGNATFDSGKGSYVEYDFYTFKAGDISIHTYMLPLFAKDKSHSTQYAVQLDDGAVVTHHNDTKEYSREWAANVLRNSAINKTSLQLNAPGKHTLRILCVDPGMILQKIVVDLGGLKASYIGPPVDASCPK